VGYVGDGRCAECHDDVVATYRNHPMGCSLAPVSSARPVERFGEEACTAFEAAGFHYLVEREGDRLLHVEERRGPQGELVCRQAAEVHYAVGSGSRGRSYLIERDGHLFQSPLTWFVEAARWDLSPGYSRNNMHFERGVGEHCVYCHANRVTAVAGTTNRYETPVFQGFAVGCERCHGPGELHARRHEQREAYAGLDETIVNPRHLDPDLREAVCQQCHLQGEQRVTRLGRDPFEYRPGLPLHLFVSVFVRAPELAEHGALVSQVEQMELSRCFSKSQGNMGCVSCHDPHSKPPEPRKAAYFREKCLACHAADAPGCSEGEETRAARADACASCHMPATASTDINHVSVSDHRILRRPDRGAGPALRPLAEHESPLRNFHARLLPKEDPELDRDLGIALAELAVQGGYRPAAALAIAYLEESAPHLPADPRSLYARANMLVTQGRPQEALQVLETLLVAAPGDEQGLFLAAYAARAVGSLKEAVGYNERVVAVNPQSAGYRLHLAELHAMRGEWARAERAAREALSLSPARHAARRVLIRALLGIGQREEARAELARYEAFGPDGLDEVRAWFRD
jgi:hypothetical protein